MAAAFRSERGTLAERMVAALAAGEHSSRGPRRGGGARSAALMVVTTLPSNTPMEGRLLDLRVEESASPLKDLRKLLKIQQAYRRAAIGQELLTKGDLDRGVREFYRAISLAPESSELKFWFALGMMRQGETRKAYSLMRSAVGRGQDVKAIMRELASRGIIGKTQGA